MPAVPPGSLVLVTGASGFIAVHVVTELLSKGYKVRGTVRSKDKGEYLIKKFGSENFSYVIVEDLENENGFDEAVKGVDAIEHTASPFHFKVEDPYKDLVHPAVNGTLSVLKSAQKNGDKVQRIVVTSSFASILDSRKPSPFTFTEEDWNEYSTAQLEEKGKDVAPADAYRASKTLAERAAWKFVEENKPKWDLVTLCPPLVLGPIEQQISSPDALNTSVSQWYAWLSGKKEGQDPTGPQSNEVDVRDLAAAHVLSISVEAAGNNRFAISKQPYTWQICLDEVANNDKVKKAWPKLPTGKPGADKLEDQHVLNAAKSEKVLGIKYRSLHDTLVDMSMSLAEHEASGWKKNAA